MKMNDSDLFFTCSLIELIGRTARQKRSAVVTLLDRKIVSHIYGNAGTLHCEQITKTAEVFIDMCKIPQGDFDNVATCKYEVPDYWTIGKVYARLIEDICDTNIIDALFRVYLSPVSDEISNYNSDFFYQPRDFIKEQFLSEENSSLQEQEKRPAIRFRGFTDAWEQRELNEMASFSKGSGYSKNDILSSGTPIILYGRLYTKYETSIRDVDTFVTAKPRSVYSRGGEVIIPASGETAEDISIASVVEREGVILGGDLNVVTPDNSLTSMFLALTITFGETHQELSRFAQGKSVVHLHNTDLQGIKIIFPSRPEQEKINSFFRRLDRLITLHQRELEKLRNIKKACLEKMFV